MLLLDYNRNKPVLNKIDNLQEYSKDKFFQYMKPHQINFNKPFRVQVVPNNITTPTRFFKHFNTLSDTQANIIIVINTTVKIFKVDVTDKKIYSFSRIKNSLADSNSLVLLLTVEKDNFSENVIYDSKVISRTQLFSEDIRFKLVPNHAYSYSHYNEVYMLNYGGKSRLIVNYSYSNATSETDFDKSGYYLPKFRNQLTTKLNQTKYAHIVADALNTSTGKRYLELINTVKSWQQKINDVTLNVENSIVCDSNNGAVDTRTITDIVTSCMKTISNFNYRLSMTKNSQAYDRTTVYFYGFKDVRACKNAISSVNSRLKQNLKWLKSILLSDTSKIDFLNCKDLLQEIN